MMIHPRPQSVKNQFFDRLTKVKEAGKASNSHSSAYRDTVEGELRSKSKGLVVPPLDYIAF